MRIFLTVAIVCSSFFAEARTLTWKEAVDLAEKNSRDLLSAVATYNSVKASEIGYSAAFLPNISAGISTGQSGAPGEDTQTSYSAGISLSQNLFSGFSDYYSYQVKKLNSEQALIDLNLVKARISQELKQIFAEVYYSQQNMKLSENILKRRQDNLRSVQLQYEVGRENKGSVLLSQANVESAEFDILRSKNSAEVNFENFRRYLGLPADEPLVIVDNIKVDPLPKEIPNFQALAESSNAVAAIRNDDSVSQYNLNISRAAFIPSLGLSAGYNYSDTKFFPENDSWSVGLSLSIPIFSGFRDYASYRSSTYKVEVSKSNLQNTLLTTLRDLKSSYFSYAEALQNEKVTDTFNRAALLRSDIARNKYKNGLLTFEDWDVIESDLIQKQRDYLSGERSRIIAHSLWEKAQGVGVFK